MLFSGIFNFTVGILFEIESSSKYTVSQKDGLKTEKTVFFYFFPKNGFDSSYVKSSIFKPPNFNRINGNNFIEGQFNFEVRSLLKLPMME